MIFPNVKTFFLACLAFFKRPELTPLHVREVRHARCQLCPHCVDGQCDICTCFVSTKVILATEKCPAKAPRWGEYFNRKNNGL